MNTKDLPSYPIHVQPRDEGVVAIGYQGPDGFVTLFFHDPRPFFPRRNTGTIYASLDTGKWDPKCSG